jgi:hypothetical protein
VSVGTLEYEEVPLCTRSISVHMQVAVQTVVDRKVRRFPLCPGKPLDPFPTLGGQMMMAYGEVAAQADQPDRDWPDRVVGSIAFEGLTAEQGISWRPQRW